MIDVAGGHFLWASNESKLVFKLYTITAIFTITLSLILIPLYYTFGALISIMIPHSIYTIYSIVLVKRRNNIKFDSRMSFSIFKYLISALTVFLLLFIPNLFFTFNLYNIVILILFSGIYFSIFFILILLLRAVTITEIKDFINILKNSISKN